MRYYIFNFQDDTTLFIEDSSVDKVRDDNKLTYYQFLQIITFKITKVFLYQKNKQIFGF